MATISRLKPGQVVWEQHKTRQGNTTMSKMGTWSLKIIEVHADADPPYVIASWNCNPPRRYYERSVRTWKVKNPLEKVNY